MHFYEEQAIIWQGIAEEHAKRARYWFDVDRRQAPFWQRSAATSGDLAQRYLVLAVDRRANELAFPMWKVTVEMATSGKIDSAFKSAATADEARAHFARHRLVARVLTVEQDAG